MPGRVIIEAALNGGRGRAANPAVQITPGEVAAEARRYADAGTDRLRGMVMGDGA